MFLEYWAASLGSLFKLLTENGSQFICEIFKATFRNLRMWKITNFEHHPKADGRSERFDLPIVSQLASYIVNTKRTGPSLLTANAHSRNRCPQVHEYSSF